MSTDGPVVAAVDFGATSVRVCRVSLGSGPPDIEVVHRHAHEPVDDGRGTLRWRWAELVAEMEKGLAAALERGPLASIGVDTWGVDYGLVDERGELVAPPVSYRDRRTDGYRSVVDRIGEAELFARTGLQLQPFNTLFQLAAHDRAELGRARHVLLLPELLVHHLTGAVLAERTSAGTTQLVDITTGAWSDELAQLIGVDPALLPPIHAAGHRAGTWQGVPVHLVGGHDTASAVMGMGAVGGAGTVFASAGTWLLVGREQEEPWLDARARACNVTNEVGALGGYRVLKNLAGGWLLERCRDAWPGRSIAELVAAAAAVPSGPTVDVSDPAFLNPPDMLAALAEASGLPVDTDPAVFVRCVIDSLAAGTARVVDELGGARRIQLFGGLARWEPLRDRLSEVSGLPVGVGPTEATALGNALVQGVALSVYTDVVDARRHLEEDP
jgi:rhamnulokinase